MLSNLAQAFPRSGNPVRTPTVLQMEMAECGAACLCVILSHFGRDVSLEDMRHACGVSRDGSKASKLVRAAKVFGLAATGMRAEPEMVKKLKFPVVVHWEFNHFMVVEGFKNGRVFVNDPAAGRYSMSDAVFDRGFTGIVLSFTPTDNFEPLRVTRRWFTRLQELVQGSHEALLFIFLVSLAAVIPGLVVPVFAKVFIDDIFIPGRGDWLRVLVLGMAITAVVRAVLSALRQHYLLELETRIAVAQSAKFFWHILRLPLSYFDARYPGDIASRVELNDRLASLVSGGLITAALNLMMVLFFGVVLFYYDPLLTLVGMTLASFNFVALRLVTRSRMDEYRRSLQENGKLEGLSMAGLRMVQTIKAGGSEDDFFVRWAGQYSKSMNVAQSVGRFAQILGFVGPLLDGLCIAAVIGLGGWKVIHGEMTIGTLIAFQSLLFSFVAPLNGLVHFLENFQEADSDMRRLEDVYQQNPVHSDQSPMQDPTGVPMQKLVGEIDVRELTFGFSRLEPPLIENLSFSIKTGSRVALVGPSGSGKSTVARLLAGLYEPWSGQVLLDGHERGLLPEPVLTNSIAMVDQDIILYEGTVLENITMWDPGISPADAIAAAKDAAIHDDIALRPGGYEAAVSEDGKNFSGGQRQRLEIARALAKRPRILILDEATSALDPQTEKRVDANLRRRGQTCCIVAHRLSTVRDCDEIIVLDKGRIVERGNHQALMAIGGLYSRLNLEGADE